MRNKWQSILILMLMILTLPMIFSYLQDRENPPSIPSTSENHPIIQIMGNLELDSFPNKTGSGTLIDPYVIKDLTLDLSGALISAIKIIDTDRYLVLQNLTINGSMGYWSTQDGGIRLLDCENINITQCLFTNNRFSTMVSRVTNCYIYNNTSHDNYSGLYTTDSNDGNVYFFNNTCYNNFEGIHADGGKYIKIYDNTCWDNIYGIYNQFGEYFEVYNNSISFCEKGIYQKYNGGNRNFNNSITNCSIGIDLFESFVNVVNNNTIVDNDIGIRYNTSNYNSAVYNDFNNVVNIEEYSSILNNQSGQFHPKISIIGDSELELFPNKTGSGIQGDPYIIENLIIDSHRIGSPIEIHSTTSFLVLRNVIVTGAHHNYAQNDGGIELYQCINVNVTNCHFIRNEFGTHLNNISDCSIFNNTVAYNWQHGIYMRGSFRLQIFDNLIHHGYSGIHTDGDYNHLIYGNIIHHVYFGMKLSRAFNCNVFQNCIADITEYGIQLYISRNNQIRYNNISECLESCIRLEFSALNAFENNRFSNASFGILFDSSSYNTMNNNQFYDIDTNTLEIDSTHNHDSISFNPTILIMSDAQLSAFPNKTGSGTQPDPYIICDLFINANGEGSAIKIQNVKNRYIIIKDSLVINAGQPDLNFTAGIEIVDCANIIIQNCSAIYNPFGIAIVDSMNCELYNNTLYGNEWTSIFLNANIQFLTDITISQNNVTNSGYGIDFDGGNNCLVSNNIFTDNSIGVELSGTSNIVIQENLFTYTEQHEIPIQIIDSFTTLIDNNSVNNNGIRIGFGIDLQNSHNNEIRNNRIYDCETGVNMYGSDSNFILDNIIADCEYGIKLEASNYNSFSGNLFQNNTYDYDEQNSVGNNFLIERDWGKIIFWIIIGVVGICSSVSLIVFIPRIKKNAGVRYANRGLSLKLKGKYEKALLWFEKTIVRDPTYQLAWNYKISTQYWLGRYKDVLDTLEEAIKINPNFALSPILKEKIEKIQVRDYIDKAIKEIKE